MATVIAVALTLSVISPSTIRKDSEQYIKDVLCKDKASEVCRQSEELLKKSEEKPLYIAVIGRTGQGKSTLVNTLAGLPESSPDAAKVSHDGEGTGVAFAFNDECHTFPGSDLVRFCDLPGYGSVQMPWLQANHISVTRCGLGNLEYCPYTTRWDLASYDAFIKVQSAERVFNNEVDRDAYTFVHKRGKPLYLVMNKFNSKLGVCTCPSPCFLHVTYCCCLAPRRGGVQDQA